MTTTPSPLSHLTTALRSDNRSLLLSTLLHDPRHPDNTIANESPYSKHNISFPDELQRQQLIFSSTHLRRTLLRNVLRECHDEKSNDQRKKKKQKGNKTQVEEEEEMMSDLNEEILGSGGES